MTATLTPNTVTQVGLLTHLGEQARLDNTLLDQAAWRPYPKWGERAAWNSLPRAEQKMIMEQAEAYHGWTWPALPATLYLDYVRDRDKIAYHNQYFPRRTALTWLTLGECLEGQGRFMDDIINGIWAICEESAWSLPTHIFSPRFPEHRFPPGSHNSPGLPDTAYPVVDLFSAETAGALAWVYYLLGHWFTAELPVVADRIVRDIQARVLQPYRTIDTWRWLGRVRRPVNNWNPWIHSNILSANFLIETDAEVRLATTWRAIEGLDAFIESYHADGGCDEGVMYWDHAGGSLYDCLALLKSATGGALDGFTLPLVQEIGRYVYRVHIGGPWYVNFADGMARPMLNTGVIFNYGQAIGDEHLIRQGRYARAIGTVRENAVPLRTLAEVWSAAGMTEGDATPPLIRDTWLDGIQVLVAREQEGTTKGLLLAAKGGHNDESHNHNDIGQFIVALDGHPVVIDAGVGVYRRETFGPERYSIWTMQSLYHNLPVINGIGQAPGREYAARAVEARITDTEAELNLDLAGAYPMAAGIQRWQRTVRLERGKAEGRVTLQDNYTLQNDPQTLALHLMTSGPVDVSVPGQLICSAPTRSLVIDYDPAVFTAQAETMALADARLQAVWGEQIYRVVLAVQRPMSHGQWSLTLAAHV